MNEVKFKRRRSLCDSQDLVDKNQNCSVWKIIGVPREGFLGIIGTRDRTKGRKDTAEG